MGSHAGLCPYGVGFAFFIVQLIIIGFVLTKRSLTRRSLLSLIAIFAIIAVIDVPTVIGRCPTYPFPPEQPPPPLNGEPPITPQEPADLGLTTLFYGLTAGLLSFASPCGLPLLPAYILYFLGQKVTVKRGFFGGFTAMFGVLVAFTLLGVVISNASTVVEPYTGVFEILASFVTLFMGVFLLLGVRIPFFRTPKVRVKPHGVLGLFVFGILWGIAIISCSPYIFISLVVYSLTLGALGASVYVGYALGLGLPIMIVAILISIGRKGVVTEFVKLAPKLKKLSGVILTIIGSSLLLYTYVLKPLANVSFETFTTSLFILIVSVILVSLKSSKRTGVKPSDFKDSKSSDT